MSEFELERVFDLLVSRIDAIGAEATQAQAQALVEWIISNVPQEYWMSAATEACHIPCVYTDISMRCGEIGC